MNPIAKFWHNLAIEREHDMGCTCPEGFPVIHRTGFLRYQPAHWPTCALLAGHHCELEP